MHDIFRTIREECGLTEISDLTLNFTEVKNIGNGGIAIEENPNKHKHI